MIGLGYEGRAVDEFITDLVAAGVTRLVDVRLTPISRKAGFSKNALAQALGDQGIAYEHRPELGNPKTNRASFGGSPSDRARAHATYVELLRRPEPAKSLDDLARLGRQEAVAVLCFEADEAHCHRRLVLEAVRSGLPHRDQPADEPYESQDLALGSALTAWSEAHAGELDLELGGPWETTMDLTWKLRLSGGFLDGEVGLRYGPLVEVAAFQPADAVLFTGAEQGVTADRLFEMLDQLAAVNTGAPMPAWLAPDR